MKKTHWKLIGVLILTLGVVSTLQGNEPPTAPVKTFTQGAWVSNPSQVSLPQLRVDVAGSERKVILTLLKPTKEKPASVGIAFIDALGNRTLVELKTLEPNRFPMRYEGGLPKAESFVGFEISFPFKSKSKKVIHSRDLESIAVKTGN